MTWLRGSALLLALLVVGGGGLWYRADREATRRATEVETSLLRKQLLERSAVRRLAPGAGISLQPIRVQGIDRDALSRLGDLPGHGSYARRCASCHTAPDPAARPSAEWYGVVDRMHHHMQRAGVIPPDSAEQAAIVGFLRAAAGR